MPESLSEPVPGPPPLAAEGARRSAACWLRYAHDGGTVGPRLVWHVWHDDAVVVLVDEREGQALPGLVAASDAEVLLRAKDTRALLGTWRARVEPVPAADPRWEAHAAALLAARLNLGDPAATLARWREAAAVVRLAPLAALT